jgi:hypothetical protein
VPLLRIVQNDSLRLYVAHAQRTWPGTPEQQSMTAGTLERLGDAIASLAVTKGATSPAITQRTSSLRASTRGFATGKPGAVAQAAALRKTFLIGAALVRAVVTASGLAKNLDEQVTSLERSAQTLDPAQPLPQQADAIEQFFRDAAAVLDRVDAIDCGYWAE